MDISRLRNAIDFLYTSGRFAPDAPVFVNGHEVDSVRVVYSEGKNPIALALNIEVRGDAGNKET